MSIFFQIDSSSNCSRYFNTMCAQFSTNLSVVKMKDTYYFNDDSSLSFIFGREPELYKNKEFFPLPESHANVLFPFSGRLKIRWGRCAQITGYITIREGTTVGEFCRKVNRFYNKPVHQRYIPRLLENDAWGYAETANAMMQNGEIVPRIFVCGDAKFYEGIRHNEILVGS